MHKIEIRILGAWRPFLTFLATHHIGPYRNHVARRESRAMVHAPLRLVAAKGVYVHLTPANLDQPLPFDKASFDAVACVGVLSYVERFDVLFSEVTRVLRPGGVFVATHRDLLWDSDERGCRSAAKGLVNSGAWVADSIGDPEPYMPDNPDPDENAKRIRLLAFRAGVEGPSVRLSSDD